MDRDTGSVGYRTYADSLNPPILHRKELLLPEVDPRRIGHRRQWDQLVRERGYRILGHALEPIGNDDGGSGALDTGADWDNGLEGWQAARHTVSRRRSSPLPDMASSMDVTGCSTTAAVAATMFAVCARTI